MGWNDRLPEDPNWPFPNQADSDAYEAWHEYLLEAEAAGLTSQNIDPATLAAQLRPASQPVRPTGLEQNTKAASPVNSDGLD